MLHLIIAAVLISAEPAQPEYAVLDFTATWCGPCKTMDMHFKDAKVMQGMQSFAFFKIDVDKEPDIAKAYRVTTIPVLVLVKIVNGKGIEIDRFVGAQGPTAILKLLGKATSSSSSP